LSIISKIENQQFAGNEKIELATFIEERLSQFEELIEMKSIVVRTQLDADIAIYMNPDLAYMMITNLLSNAVKHNLDGGELQIILSAHSLTVKNTGTAPTVPTEKLFERFSKSSTKKDSTGLGLALVKLICDIYHFPIRYDFAEPYHEINVKLS
jgi:signal transduction histidine kinase